MSDKNNEELLIRHINMMIGTLNDAGTISDDWHFK